MPVFASVTAHAVTCTMTLLMWHQIFFSRLCRETLDLPHLKALIAYYLRQCQPSPLSLLDERVLRLPRISVVDVAQIDDLA